MAGLVSDYIGRVTIALVSTIQSLAMFFFPMFTSVNAETSPTQKGQASKVLREIPNPCIAIPLYKLSCRGMTFLRRP